MQRGADHAGWEELVREAAVQFWLAWFGTKSAHNWGLQKNPVLKDTRPGGKFCISS